MEFIEKFLTSDDKQFRADLVIYPSQIESLLCNGASHIFDAKYLLYDAKKHLKRAKYELQQLEIKAVKSFWKKYYTDLLENPSKKKPTIDEQKRAVQSHSSHIEAMEEVFENEDIVDLLKLKLDSLEERNNLLQTLADYNAKTKANQVATNKE